MSLLKRGAPFCWMRHANTSIIIAIFVMKCIRPAVVAVKLSTCITAMADELIRNLYQCASADFPTSGKVCSAVIALGGYGRAELNPLSDIDVMFYCSDQNKDLAEKIAERVLYLLWDLNLDVGYSVRTSSDCLTLAQQDITIRTALLDTRFLAGDEVLFHEFESVGCAASAESQQSAVSEGTSTKSINHGWSNMAHRSICSNRISRKARVACATCIQRSGWLVSNSRPTDCAIS